MRSVLPNGGILQQHGSWILMADLCREHGNSSATLHKWTAKSGGVEVTDAHRVKAHQHENAKLG